MLRPTPFHRALGLLLFATLGWGGLARAGAGAASPLAIATEALPEGRVGQAYEAPLESRGGAGGAVTWRLVSGRLPPGLRLDGGPVPTRWGRFTSVGRVAATDGKGGLGEVSGLAASRQNPGILWALDDGGNASELLALGPDGTLRRRYTLDVENRDWEDLALGPVRPGHSKKGPKKGDVLWVADIGDNLGKRKSIRLIRVREPEVSADGGSAPVALASESFFFQYPEGPRDAEALLVDWETGIPYVLDKHGDGGAVYRVPTPLKRARKAGRPATLIRVTKGRPLPALLTAADAGRDAQRIVVRSYARTFELLRPPGEDFEAIFGAKQHVVAAPFLGQYESIALGPRGLTLWTTSERIFGKRPTPLYRMEAKAPGRADGADDANRADGTDQDDGEDGADDAHGTDGGDGEDGAHDAHGTDGGDGEDGTDGADDAHGTDGASDTVMAFLLGTPTRSGTFSFRLELRDALGALVTRRFKLTIR